MTHRGDGGTFPRTVEGLPDAASPAVVELVDGDVFDLRIAPVRKRLGDTTVRLLTYNGSVPGPTLRVRQGTEVTVNVVNDGDVEATVHWHGLRLENRYDGVPHDTQRPIPVGGRFTYRVQFPDAGIYWYHPHIREDYTQEMGLYAGIVVDPAAPDYWPPVDREITVTLDDLLLEEGGVAPFHRSGPTHTAMGRFGDVILVNGEPRLDLTVTAGEVVRFFLIDTANTRTFNVAFPGARMKLVGGDNGRVEREEFVDEVLLAPSERAVVDVLFDAPGEVPFEHRTPERTYRPGRVRVDGSVPAPWATAAFASLRRAPELRPERERLAEEIERPPDKVLALMGEMAMDHGARSDDAMTHGGMTHGGMSHGGADVSEVATDREVTADQATRDDHGDGIEWEDTMPEMNRMAHPENMFWKLVDRQTGAENDDIDWSFRVGDRVKIRLVNEPGSDHAMQHPFHIHGAGRFLVLARDETPNPNLVWKDTVLVRAGETVDILLDVTNPGLWMAHCHIAEHAESGMMFTFQVDR